MLSPFQFFVRRYGLKPADRPVLKIQFLALFMMSVVLSLSYFAQREWRGWADEHHLRRILYGWDGFAWFTWLGAVPMMLILIRRFPIARGQIRRSVVALLIDSLFIYFLVANVRFGLRLLPNFWLPPAESLPADWRTYLNTNLVLLPMDFLTYSGFFAICFAIDSHFQSRRSADEAMHLQLKAAQLESDLSQAELAMLRNQLHPHFLFNSFNAVATLVRQKKNEEAVEIIAQLSLLLRRALERTGEPTVSLENEMDFVRQYLEIEKVRFGEKLQFHFSLDPASAGGLVPNLVLQPLVENAIKHGISQRTTPGSVSIVARRRGDRLALEIVNDGPDEPRATPAPARTGSSGIGLANTRLRLDKIYGADYRFELAAREEGGVRVCLDLPWQPAPVAAVTVPS